MMCMNLLVSLSFQNTQTALISIRARKSCVFLNKVFFFLAVDKENKRVQRTYHQTNRSMSMDFIRNLERSPSISCHVHFAVTRGGKMPDDILESRVTD